MKENTPSEWSIVSEEDQPNSASETTSKHINGKTSHEMQVEHIKVEHDGEEDHPSPSGNLISTSPVKENKISETEAIQNSASLLELEALLPLTENPEPLEHCRDENSTPLPQSLPLPVLDVKPSDFGSPTGALKLPEEQISDSSESVLPNESETGANIGSELYREISSPNSTRNGADMPSTSSHTAGETENDNNSEKRANDGLELSKEAISSSSTKNDADTPFASSPQVSKGESGNRLVTSGYSGQPLAKISSLSVKTSASIHSKHPENAEIDTASPFASVKQAVSKFGGIVDWKAHRAQTMERRKFIDHELVKVNEEIPLLKKQYEAAEEAKVHVLKELDSTKRLIEELKLNLERAQIEEQEAKQDSELAKLRVEEMEQGITDEASIAAKVQLEVAEARHVSAVCELKTVTAELEQLRVDFSVLVSEKDTAVKMAGEAVSASKEVEKTVEDLTIELMSLKESLDSAHAAHLEAEEHRLGAVLAREQDILYWEKEVKLAEEELEKANEQIRSARDLKSNLDTASALLKDLKSELATYMESQTDEGNSKTEEKNTHFEMQAAAVSARKELEEVKRNLEKAMDEVNCLKVAATSLRSELEKEKSEISTIRQREGMASIAVASLEAELNKTKSDIAVAQMKEKEAKETVLELPKQLQEAAQVADQAKSFAKKAREELRKAEEEAERVNAAAKTMESRLLAAQKEIEAAKASEKLALAAINALEESESAQSINGEDSPTGVTLSLEEYYKMSKRAHEAEEQANTRVANAISQIEVAKESELKSLKKLEKVNSEMAERKEGLEIALEKAEKAKQGKLAAEQKLRKWRSEHEQKRKGATTESLSVAKPIISPKSSVEGKESKPEAPSTLHHRSSPKGNKNSSHPKESSVQESYTKHDSSPEVKKKKKKSFFPRIFMFFSRKKVLSKSA